MLLNQISSFSQPLGQLMFILFVFKTVTKTNIMKIRANTIPIIKENQSNTVKQGQVVICLKEPIYCYPKYLNGYLCGNLKIPILSCHKTKFYKVFS